MADYILLGKSLNLHSLVILILIIFINFVLQRISAFCKQRSPSLSGVSVDVGLADQCLATSGLDGSRVYQLESSDRVHETAR